MTEVKLSQQLVMTPQLQLAIRLLQMRSAELPVAHWMADTPGLEELAADAPDPLDAEEVEHAESNPPAWFASSESPLPALDEVADVWVFGNPPQARANRTAYPRLGGATKEARWLMRALRQRAKTYEKIVAAILTMRPQIALGSEPASIEPVAIRGIAQTAGMHESTITRVANGCRFQNLFGIVAMTKQGKQLAFTASPATPAR